MGPSRRHDSSRKKGGRHGYATTTGEKVPEHLVVLAYVKERGVIRGAKRFGQDRKTVRAWRDRCRAQGETGLLPRHPGRRLAGDCGDW